MKKATSKGDTPASELITRYIAEHPDWRGKTLARVRKVFHEADSEIVEEWKWMGSPVWAHGGIIAVGNAHRDKVKLTFSQGAHLPDPHKIFNAGLEGNKWRAIDLHEDDKINESALKELIRSAVSHNMSGSKSAAKSKSPPKADAKAKPGASEDKPGTSRAKPGASIAKPKVSDAKPKVSDAKPKVSDAKPKASDAKPRASKAKPKASKAKPGAGEDEPGGSKAKPGASDAKPTKARRGEKAPVLLTGGNPQIAKADGDAPVQAYIAAMPGWKRRLGERLDALIARSVPDVRKAVKWNSPLYGVEGQGWFLGLHVFTNHVKVTFFFGMSLKPLPPVASKSKDVRCVDIHEGDKLDEAQMASWVKQAAALPGWTPGRP